MNATFSLGKAQTLNFVSVLNESKNKISGVFICNYFHFHIDLRVQYCRQLEHMPDTEYSSLFLTSTSPPPPPWRKIT